MGTGSGRTRLRTRGRSLVLDLLDHRVRSGDERARRRRAVARLRGGRGGALAKPGVGAVATQASANRQYGPKAIALLEQGLSPADVVKRITDEDPGRDTRQVAVIDTKGRSAVYTGKHVIARNSDTNDPVHYGGYAGHVTGKNFSVQGNTLASEAVVKAMADAYEHGKGSMAERLMDALDAGQSKGGDTRGMQSAGILVVKPLPPNSESTVERIVDIRVDDATEPVRGVAAAARHRAAAAPVAAPTAERRGRRDRRDRREEFFVHEILCELCVLCVLRRHAADTAQGCAAISALGVARRRPAAREESLRVLAAERRRSAPSCSSVSTPSADDVHPEVVRERDDRADHLRAALFEPDAG